MIDNPQAITISKAEIAALEVETYPNKIVVVETLEEADQAVAHLSTYPVIGFDTETRPSFKKGMSHKVSLIQLSSLECCYLFRIKQMGVPPSLVELLSNVAITKVGVSLHDDFGMLRKVVSFQPKGFVELQELVKRHNIGDMSLQKIYAILFGKKISKSQRLSNWEAEQLSDGQKRYAAIDAWACVRIYNALQQMGFTYYKRENNLDTTDNREP